MFTQGRDGFIKESPVDKAWCVLTVAARPIMKVPFAMAGGECTCGAVKFEIDEALSGVFVCHCSICRRSTGSGSIAVVLVANDRFRWTQGQDHIVEWKKPGTQWEKWFCKTCGSPVPGRNDPTRMFVPAGAITHGGEGLRVVHHIWVGSKAVWERIGDDGQQHAERFRAGHKD